MAYSRPPYDARSPHESERSRSSWDTLQRPHFPPLASPPNRSMTSPGIFDPESESSDVSDTGEDYQSRIHSSYPTPLPPPLAKHILESPDAIQARLKELQKVEDLNIRKQDQLKAKRARKDDKIRRRREAQDIKIKAIMDARSRRDERIGRRRKIEDDAFERFDQDLEEEETGLRRRLKRLKRGLPVDDLISSGNRIPSASISPTAPTYSSIPPPAKRHQTGPPGLNDSPVTSTPRAVSHSTPSAPNSAGPNPPPPYAFLQSSHPPATMHYGRSPTVSHSPLSTTNSYPPVTRPSQTPSETPSFGVNGHSASPRLPRPSIAPSSVPLAGTPLNTAPPPRQPSSSYDTRPPPPASSGFAPINVPPPASGFAAINPRSTGTPPAPAREIHAAKPVEPDRNNVHMRPYALEGTPTTNNASNTGKRTPSSTHPYQQSEAFANRHHHCERVDQLNRGIWTSYGPGGTKDIPTGPPQEMYLRCNHDGCRRIDWRTVHGLQCHIVKNHEQPKGTIGSLEKALDRYGKPVAEIEAYEREHGPGSGGTMADPKNLKVKAKSTQPPEKVDGRRSYGAQPNTSAYRANLQMSFNSPQQYQGSPASVRSIGQEEAEDSESEARKASLGVAQRSTDPTNKFAAVNGVWSTAPAARSIENQDHEMRDAPPMSQQAPSNEAPKQDESHWKMWPRPSTNDKQEQLSNGVRDPGLGPNSGPIPAYGAPAPGPSQLASESIPNHIRSGFVPLVPAPASTTVSSHPNHLQSILHPAEKVEDRREEEDISVNASQRQVMNQNETKFGPIVPVRDTRIIETRVQEPASNSKSESPAQIEVVSLQETSTAAATATTQDAQAEPEQVTTGTPEPVRSEMKSPEVPSARRSSVGRRILSRRSSVAANRAEKEQREKEREEAEAAAMAEKERQDKEKEHAEAASVSIAAANGSDSDARTNGDVTLEGEEKGQDQNEQDKIQDPDQDTERQAQEHDQEIIKENEESSDDDDTITAAPPLKEKDNINVTVKETREKEKDVKEKETKTTPRRPASGRLTNGRYGRKR